MYPAYPRKNGRKYFYYVSKSELRFGAAGKTYERIPAGEVAAAAGFSMTICWPRNSPNFGAMMRVVVSVAPPATDGTTQRTGLSG